MNRSHLWKALFVAFVIIWSLTEILPPGPKNLIAEFDRLALTSDAKFTNIVGVAQELEVKFPDRGNYRNLLEAIGTNDIRPYFPTNYLAGVEPNPTRAILNRVQREAAGEFKLGLDLRGGTSFLLQMDLARGASNAPSMETSHFAEQAIEVLRKRVDAFGVAEPIIQPVGDKSILVQLPGVDESTKESAREQLKKAAFLEFRMVDPENDTHVNGGLIPPGYIRLPMKMKSRTGQEGVIPILVKRQPEPGLTSDSIAGARVARNSVTGAPEIDFSLKSDGARAFGEVTRNNVGQRLAIVLDGVVISAPVINGPILGGNGQITGQFTEKEAFELATALQNPLQAPLQIIEERGVSPRLGAEQIQSGIRASLLAVSLVAGFMLVYYLLGGLVANVALVLNVLILLAVMCSLDVTFTLPGIAGIVLTVGMAVDANVLIFERIREEQEAKKSVRGALAAGYGKAFGTILDSNLTTLISSVLLIALGTGPIKGFGVALTVGLCVSMFTSLVVTRLIFDFLLAKTSLLNRGIKMLHFFRGTKLDFMKYSKPAFVLSWIVILGGLAYAVFGRGERILGTDFAGGDTLTMSFAQKVEIPKVRAEIGKVRISDNAFVTDVEVDYPRDVAGQAGQNEVLRIVAPRDTGLRIEQQLKTAFPEAKFERIQFDQVGPVVGQSIQKSAILASLLSLFGILVYVAFRYEFSFAVGAVVAVMHDVLMTIGIFALTGLGSTWTGGWIEARQFDATFVAALLTIIGFSINDTIVIFDRIREDLKLGIPGTFRELLNKALNQTLSRTVITSGTVLLATLALYLFGGRTINNFAFTFLVGIITGTYSSIYIASALVFWWHKGKRPALGAGAVTTVSVPVEARA
ncbi:MAG TPA: protein translocase subunit SecD [Verrucomicrobiota bacterium]|nr:protein translocase subunit SecDF [Verrucomicrobiales bacterium]HRI12069.1 protein translocase subunit SecD [Verrucomicrobiota bacterium]